MSSKTGISWTDSTWNPLRGASGTWTCVKISEGCRHCYSERLNTRFGGPAYTVGADTLRLDAPALTLPLRWKRPRRIFVCSMTDLFEDRASVEWIAQVFNVMADARAEGHTFQILTKRADRMHRILTDELPNYIGEQWPGNMPLSVALEVGGAAWPLPNVWLGVSVENQMRAAERIPRLLETPATVRFLSIEPLLGPMDLGGAHAFGCQPAIDWVIVGGESGGPPERRLVADEPSSDWVRSIRDQCTNVGVPFFFKQWGGSTPKAGGCLLDDRTWDELPAT